MTGNSNAKPTVTLITRDATLDELSLADYRDIYDELRGRDPQIDTYAVSLDRFVTLVTSSYSKAQWSKYHNGEANLTRAMRNELRRAVGMSLLPPTVAEAIASASPDAAVWQLGSGPAEHVIMVTTLEEPVTLHVNGNVSVETMSTGTTERPQSAPVTPVTRAQRRHRQYIRPTTTETQNRRRLALSVGWKDVIEAGLTALEREHNVSQGKATCYHA